MIDHEQPQPSSTRRTLMLGGLAFVIVMLIWYVPQLSVVLYPFRYFVTTVHEMGHGLAALISGGRFIQYVVYGNGTGVATTAGGWSWLILPAGYVGTALFGATLLYLNNRTGRSKLIAMLLGAAFGLVTVLFARNWHALITGIIVAAGLIGLGWKVAPTIVQLLLNLLAMLTGLNAVLDLWGLLGNLNSAVVRGIGNVPNDAYAMAQLVPIIPAAFWAVLWIVTAVGLLGVSAYYTFWRPLRRRPDRSV
jgi:hypothetical protein